MIGAGGLAYADDRLDDARAHYEQAFRVLRAAGACADAARVATLLGELHWAGLGNPSIGRGWLERAHRLLEEFGPCVEWGYWELARVACDRPDVLALERSAERALAIADEYGDVGLQMRALADGGFALICQGRLGEGFSRLEEALAVLTGGEVTDPFTASTTCCALLSACDRAGDGDRATEWLRVVRELVLDPAGGRPRMLGAHCQLALGGVLCSTGRWAEAEQTIRRSLEPTAGATAAQRIEATARLGEVWIQTGNLDDAAVLLTPIEDHVAAALPLALLYLARGQPRLAAGAAQRGANTLTGDVLRQAALLSLAVEAQLACGDPAAAGASAEQLRALAEKAEAPVVHGFSALADGRLIAADGRRADAATRFEAAAAAFAGAERAMLVAQARLVQAETLESIAPEEAVAAARAAHAAAVRFGVRPLRDRCASLLRRLGVSAPRPSSAAAALHELTAREADILDGLRQGESNAQIAARVFLSPKTVEHHLSRIYAKLGVRTRAQAAALAASSHPSGW